MSLIIMAKCDIVQIKLNSTPDQISLLHLVMLTVLVIDRQLETRFFIVLRTNDKTMAIMKFVNQRIEMNRIRKKMNHTN